MPAHEIRPDLGLSPRVRGNHDLRGGPRQAVGSIPAGEPGSTIAGPSGGGVYPRVCGGTLVAQRVGAFVQGLSPRVRGNRFVPDHQPRRRGSIPACAGEPRGQSAMRLPPRVYPRVCGGTLPARDVIAQVTGLSPRVRGNRGRPRAGRSDGGSIPACAGEPLSTTCLTDSLRVYPRVCGGTTAVIGERPSSPGLSPRVRGNQRRRLRRGSHGGSIPACAGEPSTWWASAARSWVYPRVCGGTTRSMSRSVSDKGLSPRVRGNPEFAADAGPGGGSIPACAGEPTSEPGSMRAARVYPRVCGGTKSRRAHSASHSGLSPRVRGNRALSRRQRGPQGSIPACAGEPAGAGLLHSYDRVYPRVCGGTSCLKAQPS